MAHEPGRLHRLTLHAANYWAGMVWDVAGASAFLAFAVSRRSTGVGVALAASLAGLLVWSWLEYAAHRWVLHGWPPVAHEGHARHHAHPAALASSPAGTATAVAIAFWALLRIVCTPATSGFVVFGLYLGYDIFSALHHAEHHPRTVLSRLAYFGRLERVHHLHHGRPSVNFGVTTSLWDRVFGTYQPAQDRRATPAVEAASHTIVR